MRRSLIHALVLVGFLAATACSSNEKVASPAPAAVTSLTVASPTSSGPPPVNNPADAKALATLAGKAAKASYDATYDFNAVRAKGQLRIVAAPPRYRVDFSIGPQRAQFYQIGVGSVSCALRQDKPVTCALVAGPGEKIPDVFDPGVQRLFTDGLDALAKDPSGYAIEARPDSAAKSGIPAGKCFHVERLADLEPVSPGTVSQPGKGFESGDYCFDPANGVLTSVKVSTGGLTLSKPAGKPVEADFTPPAAPKPLAPPSSSAASPS